MVSVACRKPLYVLDYAVHLVGEREYALRVVEYRLSGFGKPKPAPQVAAASEHPSAFSRSRTCMDTAGWLMESSCAAFEKLLWLATIWNM